MAEPDPNPGNLTTEELVAELASGSEVESDDRICVLDQREESIEEFCDHVRMSLRNHQLVFHPSAGVSQLQVELLSPASRARKILADEFLRLVVLDVRRGCSLNEPFDLARFYRYAFKQLARTFKIPPSAEYHEEDIAQMLKDEPSSLICLINVHSAPSLERKRLRCLTQEGHPALILYDLTARTLGSEDLPRIVDVGAEPPGNEYLLTYAATTLGRHPDCDIVIDMSLVSRRQAQIIQGPDGCYLEDLGSRHGTRLNGEQIRSRVLLKEGDIIAPEPGDTSTFRFQSSKSELNDSADETPRSPLIEDDFDDSGTVIGISSESESAQNILSGLQSIARFTTFNALSHAEFWTRVVDTLFDIFDQADQVVFVETDKRGVVGASYSRSRRDAREVAFARDTLERTVVRKAAEFSVESNFRSSQGDSLPNLQSRSVMCIPVFDQLYNVIGAVQLDTADPQRRFRQEDLDLAQVLVNHASVVSENAQQAAEAEQRRVLDRDLEVARDIQLSFLPSKSPEILGYSLYSFFESSKQIGGDYYDYVPLSDGRLAIIIADVVGHGAPAALLMARLLEKTRSCFAHCSEPTIAMKELNDSYCDIGGSHFSTMTAAVLDSENHTLEIVNAGHERPIHRGRNGELRTVSEETGGVPLGIIPGFEFESLALDLAPGDLLLMYTDGVSECQNADGQIYGSESIMKQLSEASVDPLIIGESIIKDAKAFARNGEFNDDVCLLCLGRSSE